MVDFYTGDSSEHPITGTVIKYDAAKAEHWNRSDGATIANRYIAVSIRAMVQKWVNDKPIETIIITPDEPAPDVEVLNQAADKSEWRTGPDGNLVGPWKAQIAIGLLEPKSKELVTFVSGSTGGRIAARELEKQTALERRFGNPRALPIVALSERTMKTKFGSRLRPHLNVVGWFGDHGPAPQIGNSAPQIGNGGAKALSAPAADGLDDQIPF
jgi:hypothetical protein